MTPLGMGVTRAQRRQVAATRVVDLPNGHVIPHRGGADLFPEDMLESHEASIEQRSGQMFDMGDFRLTVNNGVVSMHDSTVDRTTSKSGAVNSFTMMQWKTLKGDPSTWFAPAWPDTLTPPTMEQLLDLIKRRGICATVELKTLPTASDTENVLAPLVIAAIQHYGLQDQILVVSFRREALAPVKAAGIPIGFVSSTASNTPASTPLADIQAIGPLFYHYQVGQAIYTPAYLQSIFDAGIKLSPYVFLRRADAAAEPARVGRTIAGFWSDEPVWIGSSPPAVLTTDPFDQLTYYHGMIAASTTAGAAHTRAALVNDATLGGVLKFVSTASFSSGQWMLQGWGSKGGAQASIRSKVRMDLRGGDTAASRGVGIIFGCTDDSNAAEGVNTATNVGYRGYYGELRWDGSLIITRRDGDPAATTIIAGPLATAGAIADGTNVELLVEFLNDGTIRLTRVDTGHVLISAVDNTYRGGYFHFGKRGQNTQAWFYDASTT
jgi:glycerophosphoryl diester phosphodiesterase